MTTKMNKRMLYQLLTDEFTKFGDKFEKIAHNEANGMYCYKRTTPGGLTYYEVFLGCFFAFRFPIGAPPLHPFW